MDSKRDISLKRANELHEEIKDYLEFKNEFLMDVSARRDVMSKQHKKDLLKYFDATEDDWNDWHWQRITGFGRMKQAEQPGFFASVLEGYCFT